MSIQSDLISCVSGAAATYQAEREAATTTQELIEAADRFAAAVKACGENAANAEAGGRTPPLSLPFPS